MTAEDVRRQLEIKTNDDLRRLAKEVGLSGYSSLKKSDLIELILTVDSPRLAAAISPSWWSRFHNHVYGLVTILAVVLSTIFYFVPLNDANDSYLSGARRVVEVVETPVSFVDYATMSEMDRATIFRLHLGEEVTWEGYVDSFNGFDPGMQGGFPFEKPIGLTLVPRRTSANKMVAEFEFLPVLPSDGGYELMVKLYGLEKGQRVRMTGRLGGTPDQPLFTDAYLDQVFATEE